MTSRNPVLLVHGLLDTTSVFNTMSTYLTNLGWSVHSLNLIPNHGGVTLEKLAAQVANYIDHNFAREQPLDLLGFSMGGLVTRYYLQKLGGIKRVQRYISISAPNYGTLTAYLLPYQGIGQMRPNSPFLLDLNQDASATLSQLNFTVLWSPFDLMIVPAHNSRMPIGTEIKLPVLFHSWMVSDPRGMKAVAQALKEPLAQDY